MNPLKLFRRQIQVARVSGIPVRIDYRWFVVFALSAWVIAESFEQGTIKTQHVRLDAATAWLAGLATTFGLFLSIFGHELSHALLDGMAQFLQRETNLQTRMPEDPRYAIVNGLSQLFDEPLLLRRVARNEQSHLLDETAGAFE